MGEEPKDSVSPITPVLSSSASMLANTDFPALAIVSKVTLLPPELSIIFIIKADHYKNLMKNQRKNLNKKKFNYSSCLQP